MCSDQAPERHTASPLRWVLCVVARWSRMNWEAIGAVGEILGALAVAITLAYLAIQVKYAKKAAVDATSLNRANGVQAMLLAVATNDDLRASIGKAQGNRDHFAKLTEQFDLTFEEAERVDSYAMYWFWVHWGQFAASNNEESLNELRNLVNTFYRFPYMTLCWKYGTSRLILDPVFVSFVDGILDNEVS